MIGRLGHFPFEISEYAIFPGVKMNSKGGTKTKQTPTSKWQLVNPMRWRSHPTVRRLYDYYGKPVLSLAIALTGFLLEFFIELPILLAFTISNKIEGAGNKATKRLFENR